MSFRNVFIITTLASFILSGCTTNKNTTIIEIPRSKEVVQTNGKEVFIKLPVDNRVYEKKPISDSVPSLNPKTLEPDNIKGRVIGRKTNGANQCLDNILLTSDESVALLVQDALRQAFLEKGFKIIENESNINQKTFIVSTNILNFWMWKSTCFSSGVMNAEILTDLTMASSHDVKNQSISVKIMRGNISVFDSKWGYLMSDVMAVYIDSVKKQLIQ